MKCYQIKQKTMSNIEKIRQEIERRKKICEGIFERESDTYYQGKAVAYGELLAFIDSLPEEKLSEDLEEAAEKYRRDTCNEACKQGFLDSYPSPSIKSAFIAGAEWQYKNTITFLSEVMFQDMKKGICGWGEIPEKK